MILAVLENTELPSKLTVKGDMMKSMNLHCLRLPFLLKILLISTIATLVVAIFELLLQQALFNWLAIYAIWDTLHEDYLGSYVMPFATALGEGALAVYIGKQQPLRTIFHTSSLWILVLCLHLGIFVKFLLDVPPLIIENFTAMTSIGIIMGVFLAGERYWIKRW